MTDRAKLDDALDLAARGFRVFPLIPGDKPTPAIDDWPSKATADPDKVRRFWTDPVTGWSVDRDIGIATGNGIVAIDIDVKHGKRGDEAWAALDMLHDAPPTLTFGTRSGGRHLVYRTAATLGNNASKIADGVDHRGERGFIRYHGRIIDDRPLADCPAWLEQMIGAPREGVATKGEVRPGVLVDSTDNIARAVDYLQHRAPEASPGGASNAVYITAANVKDYGISEGMCTELMLEHWHEANAPHVPIDDLQTVVANAYRYGRDPVGSLDPNADFSVPEGERPAPEADFPVKEPVRLVPSPVDLSRPLESIPPRPWIVKGMFMRGQTTVIASPGSTGKSTLALLFAAAIARGDSNLIGQDVLMSGPAWVFNFEDPQDETNLRLHALKRRHGLDSLGPLYTDCGPEKQFLLVKRDRSGNIVETEYAKALTDALIERKIVLLVIDPLASVFAANENDNSEMKDVMLCLNRIAARANCAVVVMHHVSKPQGGEDAGREGNMYSLRGAVNIVNGPRLVKTLATMSTEDAKKLGIPPGERFDYVRFDVAKSNLTRRGAPAQWFHKEEMVLPNGDEVPVPVPVNLGPREIEKASESLDALARLVLDEGGQITLTRAARTLGDTVIHYKGVSLRGISRDIENLLVEARVVDVGGTAYRLVHDSTKTGSAARAKHIIYCERKEDDDDTDLAQ